MTFTHRVLMVRPAQFGYNAQTSASNTFQNTLDAAPTDIARLAQQEFDAAVTQLKANGIDVHVVNDTPNPPKPDAVFPNNWFSTHPSGQAFVYTMLTPNRNAEVNMEALDKLGYQNIVDLRQRNNLVLEGTGSMVIDHEQKVIYACLSERTNLTQLQYVSKQLGMDLCYFTAVNENGVPIYHTNVMLFVMSGSVAVCLESIFDASERQRVVDQIAKTGKSIIALSQSQLNSYCGNMIQLVNRDNQPILVASETAWSGLNLKQQKQIEQQTAVCTLAIPTIETIGGGSARCMIAEIF